MAQQFVIKGVKLEDLHHVYDVEHDAFNGGYTYSVIRQYFDLFESTFLIAEIENVGTVGYVLAGPDYQRKRAWILTLAIKTAHQRSGIGTALMVEIQKILEQSGITKCLLTTSPQKKHLIYFYEKLNYSIVFEDTNYFGEGIARVVMARESM